jgi:hypothetical protein
MDGGSNARRPRLYIQMVYQVIAAQGDQAVGPADVIARLPIEPKTVYEAFRRLRAAGVLRLVGSGRGARSQLVEGTAMPADGRGHRLRARASRPPATRTAPGRLSTHARALKAR